MRLFSWLRLDLRSFPDCSLDWFPCARSSGPIPTRLSKRDRAAVARAVLVTASLVAVRGLVRSVRANFGFDPHSTIVTNLDFASSGYSVEASLNMQKRLIEDVVRIPGMESAAWVNGNPPLVYGMDTSS